MYQKILIFIALFMIFDSIQGQISIVPVNDCPIKIEQDNKKYQILKCNGEIILNDIDSIGFNKKNNSYIVKKDNKYGMFSSSREIIPVEFDEIKRLFNWYWLVKSNNKYGIYNTSGEKILDTIYDEITFPSGIWAPNAEFTVKKNDKYGIYNGNGNATVPIIYDQIKYARGVFALILNNENHFLINNRVLIKDRILLDKIFELHENNPSENKTFYIFQREDKQGILDKDGNVLMKPKYNEIIPSSKKVLLVQLHNRWGVIDINDNIIIPIVYESIEFTHSTYLILGKDNMKQFYNLETQQLITDYYFERYAYIKKYSRIEKNGLSTLIDNETLKLLFPFEYESISYDDEYNNFTVKLNNKYGIIDINKNIIVPIIYDNYLVISCENKIVVQKDFQYGIIDLDNNFLFPLSDRYIVAYSNYFLIRNEIGYGTKEYDCNLKIKEEN